jgi:hypothetical protein
MVNKQQQLSEPSMEDIMYFLATYRLDASKNRWLTQNSLRVVDAIINRDVEPENMTRKHIAGKTGLSIAEIAYSIGELRRGNLLEPSMPYALTENFEPYTACLKRTVATAKLLESPRRQ